MTAAAPTVSTAAERAEWTDLEYLRCCMARAARSPCHLPHKDIIVPPIVTVHITHSPSRGEGTDESLQGNLAVGTGEEDRSKSQDIPSFGVPGYAFTGWDPLFSRVSMKSDNRKTGGLR